MWNVHGPCPLKLDKAILPYAQFCMVERDRERGLDSLSSTFLLETKHYGESKTFPNILGRNVATERVTPAQSHNLRTPRVRRPEPHTLLFECVRAQPCPVTL